ncbi:Hypothetical protein GLP15_1137 [Giardia lamblia P15]|uniref:Trimethylguanosine synthase n=1 Tax=Giardia intestinalis (strain P15) TaxID=658858 RepID=E1F8L0_GIAIA|nr:Hypothetical protein GLP15_1137 [Giardia lamblia P15]
MSTWLLDRKCVERMSWLFSDLPEEKRLMIKMNEVAFFSVTPAVFADKVAKMMRTMVAFLGKPPYAVIDGTACVGGDTRLLAKHFDMTVAIEKDPETYALLRDNLTTWGVDAKTISGDTAALIPQFWTLIGAVATFSLYLDPPWGGVEYRSQKDIQLTLGSLAVEDVVNRAFEAHLSMKLAVLKLPRNYNCGYLFRKLGKHEVFRITQGNFFVFFVARRGSRVKEHGRTALLQLRQARNEAEAKKNGGATEGEETNGDEEVKEGGEAEKNDEAKEGAE